MMDIKHTVLAGIVTGSTVKLITGNLGMAIFTALLTGMAAYVGNQIAKYLHKKIKR